MDMHKKDEQLLRSFCDGRGLKDVTYESYATKKLRKRQRQLIWQGRQKLLKGQ